MTTADPPSELGDEERALLRYAAVLTSIAGGSPTKERSKQSLIEKLANSAAVVALITVIGGGIAGTVITAKLQMKAKEREIATAENSQYVHARLQVVSDAYDLLGRTIWSSTELIVITGPEFTTAVPPQSENEKATAGQKQDIRKTFNEVDRLWNSGQQRTGLLLSYYHNGAAEVTRHWHRAASAVDAYSDCARSWYLANENRGADYKNACQPERRAVDEALIALTSALDTARAGAPSG
jgi:hypothetical protein